jgi:NTE family protein
MALPKTPADPAASARRNLPFGCVALLLQGGGALGSFQGGVYQALAEADLHPDWVAGISIGAINGAIVAGNEPSERVAKLRAFWEAVTAPVFEFPGAASNAAMDFDWVLGNPLAAGPMGVWAGPISAATAVINGAPDFFRPRVPPPYLHTPGGPAATSFYDVSPLKATLERLIDFDRINAKATRYSAGAVNVRSGNFIYFDSHTHHIEPRHVMASGALPPGFPPVEIDGDYYWDGGLVSNTPLDWVLDACGVRQDTLAFQVDLWSARGALPRDLVDVAVRQKEIQYSSRTRASTDKFKRMQQFRESIAEAIRKVPPGALDEAEMAFLRSEVDPHVYNIVHLIYRAERQGRTFGDFEFSRATMEAHWKAGYDHAVQSLRDPEILRRPTNADGVAVFDLGQPAAD